MTTRKTDIVDLMTNHLTLREARMHIALLGLISLLQLKGLALSFLKTPEQVGDLIALGAGLLALNGLLAMMLLTRLRRDAARKP